MMNRFNLGIGYVCSVHVCLLNIVELQIGSMIKPELDGLRMECVMNEGVVVENSDSL